MDVFENLLSDTTTASLDPHDVFGADITWLDPKTKLWKWLEQTLSQMTNNRRFQPGMKIHNIFEVSRPTWDKNSFSSVKRLPKHVRGSFPLLQHCGLISSRHMSDYGGNDIKANVYLGIHGTRAVNVMPYHFETMQLPQYITGVHMTGVDFEYGIYFATDWKEVMVTSVLMTLFMSNQEVKDVSKIEGLFAVE